MVNGDTNGNSLITSRNIKLLLFFGSLQLFLGALELPEDLMAIDRLAGVGIVRCCAPDRDNIKAGKLLTSFD